MTRIEITGGFRDELVLTHRYQEAFKDALPDDVLLVSERTMWKIKRISPVRSGRARTTWGKFTPETMVYLDPKNVPNANESIWEVSQDGLTITQGADIRPYNYWDDLNAGSSVQAPAMFLDVAAEQAGDDLIKQIQSHQNPI